MLIDAREVPDGTVIRGDLCLVGAGAAGITIAGALRDTPYRVVLLESGGLDYDAETQRLAEGTNIGAPMFHAGSDHALETTRLRYFGGSTAHWSGWCRPLEPLDFERRDWIPDSGWPFGHDELARWYDGAHDLCQVGPRSYDWRWWSNRFGLAPPLVETDNVTTTLYQLGPPTRFGETYRADIVDAPHIDTYLWANAVELALDGNRLAGVDVATLTGRRFRVECRATVLATGGLEVPRVLLAARSQRPSGIGNEHDLVGRYFMEHSHLAMEGVISVPRAEVYHFGLRSYGLAAGEYAVQTTRAIAALALTPQAQRRHGIGAFSALLIPGRIRRDRESVLTQFAVSGLLRGAEEAGDGSRVLVGVRSEQVPNRESRVSLGGERDSLGMPRLELAWRPTLFDRQTIQTGLEILGRSLGRLGLGRIRSEIDGRGPFDRNLGIGYHHMGTARMNADPTRGVVDRNCKVHSVDNLYVAGSAVFPTCGFSNPTLTLVALALRLADHLRVKVLS